MVPAQQYKSPICVFELRGRKKRLYIYPLLEEVDVDASIANGSPVLTVPLEQILTRALFGSHSVREYQDAFGHLVREPICTKGLLSGYSAVPIDGDIAFRVVPRREFISLEWFGGFRPSPKFLARIEKSRYVPGLLRSYKSETLVKLVEEAKNSITGAFYFDGEKEFQLRLASEPVTTLATLGYEIPVSCHTALCVEWYSCIRSLAKRYAGRSVKKDGHAAHDLVQEGNLALIEALGSFTMSSFKNRFYVYAYRAIQKRMYLYLQNDRELLGDTESVEEDESIPLITTELPTDDQADYLAVAEPAQKVLARIINGSVLHDTYKRVVRARLTAEGNCVERLIDQYKTWTCPLSGVEVDLSEKTPRNRVRWMERRYAEAFKVVRSMLSTEKVPDEVDLLTHTLLGDKEKRVLSPEGQIVRRWLELEVSMQSRGHRRTLVPLPGKSVIYSHAS